MTTEAGGTTLPAGFTSTRKTTKGLSLHPTSKFTHHTSPHLLSPALLSSPSFPRANPTYTTYELRYRFHPPTPLPATTTFSLHVFLGPVPAGESWLDTAARIGGHGISSSHDGGVSGVIPLTRTVLERCGTLEKEVVMEYLRRELRWVVEKEDGVADAELVGMFRVRVASAEVCIAEEKAEGWVVCEGVVDGEWGRLK